MPEVPVASLDPRHQKLIENARIALDRGNHGYVLEVTAQVLKTQPGCLPVRKLQRVAQLRAAKGKGGFMARMSSGLSTAPFMFGGGKKEPAKLLEQAEGFLAKDPNSVPALKMLAEFCLLCGSTVGLLMKRDTELAVAGGHLPAKEAGSRKNCGGEGGERGAEHAWPASCVFVGVGGRCS